MKTYMAVFTGNPSTFDKYMQTNPDPEKRKAKEREGMDAWEKWGKEHKKSIVADGGPLGRTKRGTKEGIADFRNNLAAYTIVKADSQEEASTSMRRSGEIQLIWKTCSMPILAVWTYSQEH